jgi:hypothetical protein
LRTHGPAASTHVRAQRIAWSYLIKINHEAAQAVPPSLCRSREQRLPSRRCPPKLVDEPLQADNRQPVTLHEERPGRGAGGGGLPRSTGQGGLLGTPRQAIGVPNRGGLLSGAPESSKIERGEALSSPGDQTAGPFEGPAGRCHCQSIPADPSTLRRRGHARLAAAAQGGQAPKGGCVAAGAFRSLHGQGSSPASGRPRISEPKSPVSCDNKELQTSLAASGRSRDLCGAGF